MTRHVLNRLSAAQVQNLKTPGKYADGGGLFLIVDDKDRKRWTFRYTRSGKRNDLGLGRVQDVPLATARRKAAEYREANAAGIDPLAAKHQTDRTVTFGDYADGYIETMRPSWRNAKHADQWVMTLTKYAAPLRGRLIHEITTEDVVSVLKQRWQRTPETAERLRGRIESVLDSAKALGLRDGDNPARWRGHLDQILPGRRRLGRGHHAALPFDRMAAFMKDLEQRPGLSAMALAFTILTAARTSEVLEARWEEFDAANAIWTVPGARMKAGREHRVPLSPQALAILERLDQRGPSTFVFSRGGRKPQSIMAMAMVLRRMEEAVTVHGFRSTFRDWGAEVTNFPNEVCEMALAHAIPGKAEAAYRRGDLFLKRRRLMEQWGRYCLGVVDQQISIDRPAAMPALDEVERKSVHDLLANARCPLCGSGWGDPCRTADESILDWAQSHEHRYGRLVEDWALATDHDLVQQLAAARNGCHVPKIAVIKLELARRSLTPSAWVRFASGG
jgi:integrase